jgi:primosomal protein N' (replication factor Y)
MSIFYYPEDLRLTVVEEENSPYYFQEEKPFHNLVDVALMLSELKRSELLLSGDYPSLSTYKHIQDKKISLRDESRSRETINIIGGAEYSRKKIVSPVLVELLRKKMQDGRKCVILWNKKGFARMLSCSGCGYVAVCQHCSSMLQVSLKDRAGICPYCQRTVQIPELCPRCKKGYFQIKGYGIERLQVLLKKIFPEARISTWEKRTPESRIIISTSKILAELYAPGSYDSGFVLDVDSALTRPDYNATFNTFIYLKKLSSFFGGRLYVFTSNRDYYLFGYLNAEWELFYQHELGLRKAFDLPPYGYLATITLRAKNKNSLLKTTRNLYNTIRKHHQVYGPFEETPFKMRDKFRYSLIVKAGESFTIRKEIKKAVMASRACGTQLAATLR